MYRYNTLILIIIFILFTGCQQKQEDNTLQQPNTDDRFIEVKNSHPDEKKDFNNEQIAVHLARVASNVPHVQDAAAVVAGPYAVVGIDVAEDIDRQRVGTIKYTVTEALQEDPYGKTAVVIADGDIMARIRGMGDKIQQGYPVQGVVDELAAIIARYMPDLPINEDLPEEPDQNKENISDKEEEKLQDIQKEQSGEH
ncbi:YhcN/YlaJ family sporulation lipoprotein [Virgibacillus sp. W0430]|uniref:YhcN/YlaJ family sporulation lipoprotein n=1 Tax=Virgibacillus sp. W0430 TaxID=3391580 RepID=UPI003F462EE7